MCLPCICSLAMHMLICVTFSLPPGVWGWLRLLLVTLPGLFCLPFFFQDKNTNDFMTYLQCLILGILFYSGLELLFCAKKKNHKFLLFWPSGFSEGQIFIYLFLFIYLFIFYLFFIFIY